MPREAFFLGVMAGHHQPSPLVLWAMFYIFHGDDSHTQKATLRELIGKLGDPAMLDLNTTRLEGKAITLGQIQDSCNAMPFLAPKRLVLVYEFLASKPDKKVLDGLAKYLVEMPDTARLFFLESQKLAANHALLKLAEANPKKGYARQFERPQGSQLEKWIVAETEKLGGRMHPRAANLLAMNAGNDLALLEQEITKLVMYKGLGETAAQITADDVALLSPYAAEINIFDLVDALGQRTGKRAAELLHKKIEEGTDPFQIFAMFVRQFRLLIQVKELAEAGQKAAAISQELKLHSFVANKLYQQASSFQLPQLEQIYSHLLDIDVKVKTGKTDMTTALHLLVFAL